MHPGSNIALFFVLASVLSACAAPSGLSREEYQRKLPDFRAAAADTSDASAQRTYGEALVYTGRYEEATRPLERVLVSYPDDAAATYFLGIAREGSGDAEGALGLYARHVGSRQGSPYHALLEGRHQWLRREMLRRETATLLDQESSRSMEGDLVVLPFAYGSGDPAYEALGRGMSELLRLDLEAAGVRVMDHDRVQVALDALALTGGRAFDRESVLRIARLLRSGRVVVGEVDVDDGRLEVSVALWDWTRERSPRFITWTRQVDEVAGLHTDVTSHLLERLHASAPAEAPFPTQNLQALTAFSRALVLEDESRYTEAADLYRAALDLDAGFSLAASRARRAERVATQVGDLDAALEMALAFAPAPEVPALVLSRLGRLNGTVGAHVVPSGEGRDPGTDIPLASTLPPPPPPPQN